MSRQKPATEEAMLWLVAVGTDRDPRIAWEYLQGFRPFNEVIIGGGWRNEGTVRFVWRDHVGVPEVPQIIFLRRHLSGPGDGVLQLEGERVAARAIGRREIQRWLEYGTADR